MSPHARTAASVLGIVAAFALVLYLAYGSGGGGSAGDPSPSAAVAGSPTQRPQVTAPPHTPAPRDLPPVLDGAEVELLENRSLVNFPEDTALIMETGCWECDDYKSASTGLRRMYRDPSGELRIEQILSLDQLPLSVSPAYEPYFTGYAIAPDASYMLTAVCIRGGCAYGRHNLAAYQRVAIFESTDGGVTWSLLEELDIALTIEGLLASGVALVSWQEQPFGPRLYGTYPGSDPVTPPDRNARPVLAAGGEPIWQSPLDTGRLLRSDGSVFVDFGARAAVHETTLSGTDGLVPVSWEWSPGTGLSGSLARKFVSLITPTGEIAVTFEVIPEYVELLSLHWYVGGSLIGTLANPPIIPSPDRTYPPLPSIFDLAGPTLYNQVEEPFLQEDYQSERNLIRAVQTGPFARVTGVEGLCLNVREEPRSSAPAIDCIANGVLLTYSLIGYSQGTSWLHVTAPSGTVGYAAGDFLEYCDCGLITPPPRGP